MKSQLSLRLVCSAFLALVELVAIDATGQNCQETTSHSYTITMGKYGDFHLTMCPNGNYQATEPAPNVHERLNGVSFLWTYSENTANRTRIMHKEFMAYDSKGRTRIESYYVLTTQDQPNEITIRDPMANQRIVLAPRTKIAMIWPLDLKPGLQSETQAFSTGHSEAHANLSTEDLPGRTINGIYAVGHRTALVIPAGTEGNQKDMTFVVEYWEAPELEIQVLRKISYPQREVVTEIKDFSKKEPAPELFQVPSDYTVFNVTPAEKTRMSASSEVR